MYDVPQLKQIVVREALAEGLVLDPNVAEAAAAAIARPATPTSKKDNSTQLVISWTFVPKQISTPVTGGPTTTSNPIQQVQGQYTWKKVVGPATSGITCSRQRPSPRPSCSTATSTITFP
jgi:hypothetical protein